MAVYASTLTCRLWPGRPGAFVALWGRCIASVSRVAWFARRVNHDGGVTGVPTELNRMLVDGELRPSSDTPSTVTKP